MAMLGKQAHLCAPPDSSPYFSRSLASSLTSLRLGCGTASAPLLPFNPMGAALLCSCRAGENVEGSWQGQVGGVAPAKPHRGRQRRRARGALQAACGAADEAGNASRCCNSA